MLDQILKNLASIGLAASVTIHLLSFRGFPVAETIPAVWALHLGVFLVLVPTTLLNRGRSFGGLLTRVPQWLLGLAIAGGFALFISGLSTFATSRGVAEERDGQYLLVNKGTVLRELTEEEFRHQNARQERGFSAIWAIFYGAAWIMLFFPGRADTGPSGENGDRGT